jgi:hypothetical protein
VPDTVLRLRDETVDVERLRDHTADRTVVFCVPAGFKAAVSTAGDLFVGR